MALHVIKKGLNLPITGAPDTSIVESKAVSKVAVLAEDFHGMKPRFDVKVGDFVKRGQPLFEDRKTPGVLHCAPAAGTVSAINRGERRVLQSVVIDLSEGERRNAPGPDEIYRVDDFQGGDVDLLKNEELRHLLAGCGLWTAFRTRPYGKVPAPDAVPHAIFVNAMTTEPLAASPEILAKGQEHDLNVGLKAVSKLTPGRLWFCRAHGSKLIPTAASRASVEEFEGPHPAGNVGTHIHMLDPVSRGRIAWYISLQDVVAIGKFLRDGVVPAERTITLAGPGVKKPRLIRTRLGASLGELTAGELSDGEMRIISGSVLSGRKAQGEVFGYLGRYAEQISVLPEGRQREFFGWLSMGVDKFSVTGIYLSRWVPDKLFRLNTNTNGSPRAIVPIGVYEKVMPLDILPTHLLRSIAVNDVETAEKLGALELEEEDLALCTLVCPSKYEFGPILRRNLEIIEHEG
ncbi:MAG: Na(+)-translocating NADH-quinone reductase subunit A [Candidatus Hydrogenedens sp.]|nr:Na(+)-translocating NADH-quinone reductase subunit A [Candidatus Hydrogenedens sp.]